MMTDFTPFIGILLFIIGLSFYAGHKVNMIITSGVNYKEVRQDIKELTQATHSNASFAKVLAESHEKLASQVAENHQSTTQDIKELTRVVNGVCLSLAKLDKNPF